MPSRRKLQRYPIWFFDLIRQAQRFPVTMEHPSPAILRRHLYNFRSALREASRQDPDNAHLALTLARAERLTFSLQPSALHVTNATAIEKGLKELICQPETTT